MLHSALTQETDAYPSIQQKAARLGFGLIRNHAFIKQKKKGTLSADESDKTIEEKAAFCRTYLGYCPGKYKEK